MFNPGHVEENDRKSQDTVTLTNTSVATILDYSWQDRLDLAQCILHPLKYGKPVVLKVDDVKVLKKKRAQEPLLFLTPLLVYGRLSGHLCIAYQANGCEVVDTTKRISPVVLMRVGLSARLSMSLARALTCVFLGESYASSASKT